MDHGVHIRLVKGGCRERRHLAFQAKIEIDDAFRHHIERLLKRGRSPAIATHDAEAIAWTRECRHRLGLSPEVLEFQTLFGVKPELQGALVADGYSVRSYIPYGGPGPPMCSAACFSASTRWTPRAPTRQSLVFLDIVPAIAAPYPGVQARSAWPSSPPTSSSKAPGVTPSTAG